MVKIYCYIPIDTTNPEESEKARRIGDELVKALECEFGVITVDSYEKGPRSSILERTIQCEVS